MAGKRIGLFKLCGDVRSHAVAVERQDGIIGRRRAMDFFKRSLSRLQFLWI
jgi:hypothetical protein